jgi:hypothetical protein
MNNNQRPFSSPVKRCGTQMLNNESQTLLINFLINNKKYLNEFIMRFIYFNPSEKIDSTLDISTNSKIINDIQNIRSNKNLPEYYILSRVNFHDASLFINYNDINDINKKIFHLSIHLCLETNSLGSKGAVHFKNNSSSTNTKKVSGNTIHVCYSGKNPNDLFFTLGKSVTQKLNSNLEKEANIILDVLNSYFDSTLNNINYLGEINFKTHPFTQTFYNKIVSCKNIYNTRNTKKQTKKLFTNKKIYTQKIKKRKF